MARLFNRKHTYTLLYKGMVERTFFLKIQGFRACNNLELPYNLYRQISNYYISSIYSLKISSMKSALAGV